jgi:hypothetical protein
VVTSYWRAVEKLVFGKAPSESEIDALLMRTRG